MQCAAMVRWFGSRHIEAEGTSGGCVNSITVNNSRELPEVLAKLERILAHCCVGEADLDAGYERVSGPLL